ncbi:hypothetical protein [Oceanirhabdus sp. W0125-5]|uniref:hypothetical protein n=1 Tax=Oceanirhabdus sp. W0125-5 TaxID=2999116 RepID=UPI0022F33346|nr:hypothetical protein [Oceanirhabdus sp. W0125-5]WBW98401.1 hypothetical protein OW730_06435 [Oceanirhabdus sp. W0125-5]
MKKILCLSIVLLMSLTLLVSCGDKSPNDEVTSAVKNTLTSLKKFDTKKLQESTTGSADIFNESEGDELFSPIFSNMEFKVIETKVNDNKAVVTTEIESIDFTEFIGFMMQEALTLSFSGIDEETMQKKLIEKIEKAIKDNKFSTTKRTVKINCKKIDGEWKVVADETLIKALFGEALSQFGDAFNMD